MCPSCRKIVVCRNISRSSGALYLWREKSQSYEAHAARSASWMNLRIASVDINHRCPTRTNFRRPERQSSRTAQQVVDINFAVVGISCKNAGVGASEDTSEGYS